MAWQQCIANYPTWLIKGGQHWMFSIVWVSESIQYTENRKNMNADMQATTTKWNNLSFQDNPISGF